MYSLQVLDTFLTECTANAGNHLSFWWVNPTHLSKQAKGNERHDGAKFQWVNSRNITIAYGIDVNTYFRDRGPPTCDRPCIVK